MLIFKPQLLTLYLVNQLRALWQDRNSQNIIYFYLYLVLNEKMSTSVLCLVLYNINMVILSEIFPYSLLQDILFVAH